ncbi:biliverdin-producing heme oxygenase [Mucilaginibacter rubeus]|uniref:Biliverdin-producing heme oxygenase n=1 Tax=Mucilaginibacter rubeus TaxID=2027860 RepID=A0AAE6JJB2_9SPHI|nr:MULTISPECIES: biliverdin-producing heme oxygenase [Mucilaginibacter]QEM05955.1 biliverdin-producing heme oxygenase [Mucilaginibacter rubeus]QEM18535.1 biliverdin-producing heme oxygenase [Mucilaginibacter gossypii]QTE44923.1 biliverdin-producing heme oxygenase [Mucilaginibacter rubeus]QTE51520.1 biliverdin-producing heme oxygenase [Mucilaginibacter rubeus]QTE56607.1 biliverdin-producing heme oxygenase [Mucilaginibacter rubeus]
MLHEKIKQATAHLHDQLEQKMFTGQIMDGSFTFKQYQTILTVNYATHLAVEDFLFNNLSDELCQKLNIEARIKLPALLRDLEEINSSVSSSLPEAPEYIDLNSDASILGAMYVLEGATLGGNVIAKRLKTNGQLLSYNLSYHYYQVYGDQLGLKWKQFLEVLNAIPEAEHEAAIKNAVCLFEHMANTEVASTTVILVPPEV